MNLCKHTVFSVLLFYGLVAIPAADADEQAATARIGRTLETSVAVWPEPVAAPEGAPIDQAANIN